MRETRGPKFTLTPRAALAALIEHGTLRAAGRALQRDKNTVAKALQRGGVEIGPYPASLRTRIRDELRKLPGDEPIGDEPIRD